MFCLRTYLCGALAAAAMFAGSTAEAVSLQTVQFDRSAAASAKAEMSNFLASNTIKNLSVETFEGLIAWDGVSGTSNPANTKVGSFTAIGTTGSGRSSINGGTALEVRHDNTMQWGRYNSDTPASDLVGSNWLDSNDNQGMQWDVEGTGKFNTIAFFLTDVADVGGKFSIKVGNTIFSDLASGARLANGNIHFVLITLENAVNNLTVTLMHDRSNDGFGIDGAMVGYVAPVPLPPAGALLLTGLVAAAGLRRRRHIA